MSQINRPPLGLQELLGSQNFGLNPPELLQTVQSTIDLSRFYGAGLLKAESSSGGRVDEGEVCNVVFNQPSVLLAVSAVQTSPHVANESMSASFRLRGINGTGSQDNVVLWSDQPVTWQSGSKPTWSHNLPYPICVPAGTTVSFWYDYAGLTGPLTTDLRCLVWDLNPSN